MSENDALLLDFTPDQYEKYLSVLANSKKGRVSIELLPQKPLPDHVPEDKLKDLLSLITAKAEELIRGKAQQDLFLSFLGLSQKEKEEYMAVCYGVINALSGISARIMELSRDINKGRKLWEEAYLYRVRRYHSYLPYRAALANVDIYRDELRAAEELLLSEADLSLRAFKRSELLINVISFTCETAIPSFLSKLGAATGAPPYTELSQSKIFAAVRDLCEQINIQIRRISA